MNNNDNELLSIITRIIICLTICIVAGIGGCTATKWKMLSEGYTEQQQPSTTTTTTNWVKK